MRSKVRFGPVIGGIVATAGLVIAMSAPVFAASQSGTFEATAYAPTAQDNYPYGPTDMYGRPLVRGDIAVDPSVIQEKSCLLITGYSSPYLPAGGFIGEADDTGGAIKGHHVDIFINASESQVNNFGIQTVHVTVLGPATNPSAAGTAACAGYSIGQGSNSGSSTNGQSSGGGSGSTGQGGAASGSGSTGQGGATGGSASSGQGGSTATGGSGAAVSPSGSSFGTSVAQLAETELGKPYVWGGTSPAGFDCSGLVQWVFAHLGVQLPRLSGQQYTAGTPVAKANLEPGDLVFFTTYKPGPSHVGIYIGATSTIQHAFVAADNPTVGVTINNLDSAKWTRLFVGARRIAAPTGTVATGN